MKDVTSLRGALEFIKERGELLTITREVNPILEISGIQKATDNGATVLFENIKGYSGVRDVGNVTGNVNTVAAMFGLKNKKEPLSHWRAPVYFRPFREFTCIYILKRKKS